MWDNSWWRVAVSILLKNRSTALLDLSVRILDNILKSLRTETSISWTRLSATFSNSKFPLFNFLLGSLFAILFISIRVSATNILIYWSLTYLSSFLKNLLISFNQAKFENQNLPTKIISIFSNYFFSDSPLIVAFQLVILNLRFSKRFIVTSTMKSRLN